MYIFEATYYNDEAGGEERKSTIHVDDHCGHMPEIDVYVTAMCAAYDGKKEDEELTTVELIGC